MWSHFGDVLLSQSFGAVLNSLLKSNYTRDPKQRFNLPRWDLGVNSTSVHLELLEVVLFFRKKFLVQFQRGLNSND